MVSTRSTDQQTLEVIRAMNTSMFFWDFQFSKILRGIPAPNYQNITLSLPSHPMPTRFTQTHTYTHVGRRPRGVDRAVIVFNKLSTSCSVLPWPDELSPSPVAPVPAAIQPSLRRSPNRRSGLLVRYLIHTHLIIPWGANRRRRSCLTVPNMVGKKGVSRPGRNNPKRD